MNIQELHRKAMDFVDYAFMEKRRGDESQALAFFRCAFILETEAAAMLFVDPSNEPTRSVLHRSAATLALDCHDYHRALELAVRGLAGTPPAEIAKELKEVCERAVNCIAAEAHAFNLAK